MTERIMKHYDPPVPFEKYVPAMSRVAKPKNPTKPQVRNARNVPIDDEIGEVAEAKKGNNNMIMILPGARGMPCLIGWPVLGRQ
jgi:hypothetical protein